MCLERAQQNPVPLAQIPYLQLPRVALGWDSHTYPDSGVRQPPLLCAVTASARDTDPAEPPKEVIFLGMVGQDHCVYLLGGL